MSGSVAGGYAFNRTRSQYLATRLSIADTHWSRLRGLVGKTTSDFQQERGLWIVPCRGVHTLGMRFPIDVIYLSPDKVVVHLETALAAMAPGPMTSSSPSGSSGVGRAPITRPHLTRPASAMRTGARPHSARRQERSAGADASA